MKVKDLIDLLQKLPQEAEIKVPEPVCGYMDDLNDLNSDDVVLDDNGFLVLY